MHDISPIFSPKVRLFEIFFTFSFLGCLERFMIHDTWILPKFLKVEEKLVSVEQWNILTVDAVKLGSANWSSVRWGNSLRLAWCSGRLEINFGRRRARSWSLKLDPNLGDTTTLTDPRDVADLLSDTPERTTAPLVPGSWSFWARDAETMDTSEPWSMNARAHFVWPAYVVTLTIAVVRRTNGDSF